MLGRKKKLSTDLYIQRLLSLEGEITFNQVYFMLTGSLPNDLYETVQVLGTMRDNKVINEASHKMIIGLIVVAWKQGQDLNVPPDLAIREELPPTIVNRALGMKTFNSGQAAL